MLITEDLHHLSTHNYHSISLYIDLDNFLEDIIYAISAEITLNPMIEAIITQLRDVLTVNSNRYEVCPVINEQLVDIVRIIVTDRFNNEDIPTEQCIDDAIKEKTNMDAIWKLSSSLIKLYANIVPAIEMIQSFLTTQENRIENVSVSSGCVNGFIETSFCRQCTQRTPPLCLATCNALVRGCYSPFYTILNGQFSALWNEVRTVINSTVTLVQYALSNAGKLVDTRAVVSFLYWNVLQYNIIMSYIRNTLSLLCHVSQITVRIYSSILVYPGSSSLHCLLVYIHCHPYSYIQTNVHNKPSMVYIGRVLCIIYTYLFQYS